MTRPLESRGGFSEDGDGAETVTDKPDTVSGGRPRYAAAVRVGRGSMGVVEAVLDRRLGREVARKRLRSDAGERGAARLRREAAVAASLEHPAIAAVYDVGEGEEGPWYTMRLVRGQTLAEALAERRTLAERVVLLRRFLRACEAVAYGHRRGVIHRDLKPANIMLGDEGQTHVVDWGLARPDPRGEREGPLPEDPNLTTAGAVVGTPAYMAPEQAGAFGEAGADARSDVWALGAMLHELLTGERPLAGTSQEVLAALRDGGPRLERLEAAPAELAAVVARALQHHPDDRYPSAGALTEDLERYLEGRLVEAYPYGPLDHLRRFVRAFRLPLAVASVAAVGLLISAGVAYHRVHEEGDRARAAEDVARAALVDAEAFNAELLATLATREARRGRRVEAEDLGRRALALAPSPAARGVLAALSLEDPPREIGTAPRCSRERASPNGRLRLCFEDGRAIVREGRRARLEVPVPPTASGRLTDEYLVLWGLDPSHRFALFGLDGQLLDEARVDANGASAAWRDQILLQTSGGARWQRSAHRAEHLDPCDGARPSALAIGPRGLAFACPDQTVRAAGRTWRLGAYATSLAWLGEDLAAGTRDGRLELLHAERGWSLNDGAVLSLRADAQGSWLAASTESEGLWIWRPERGLPQRLPAYAHRVAHLGAGHLEALGAASRTRWRLPTGPVARLDAGAGVASLDADAGWIVVGRGDGCVRLFDPGGAATTACGSEGRVVKAVVLDGPRVVVHRDQARDLEVRDRQLELRSRILAGGYFKRVVRLASGALVAATYGVGRWRIEPGGRAEHLEPGTGFHLDLDASAETVVALTADGQVTRILGDRADRLRVVDGARAVAVDPAGRVFVATRDRVTTEGAESARSPSVITALRVDGRGRWVAVGHRDGLVRVLDARLRDVAVYPGHAQRVSAIDWDGDVLVTGSWDGTIRRWDARRWQ